MTDVIFKKKNENLVAFKIEGHAGFDDFNRDIVCSGISILSQATLIGIEEILKVNVEYFLKDGFLSLSLEKKSMEDIEKCQVLLQTMLLGLKSVEVTYGDYINVKVEEV